MSDIKDDYEHLDEDLEYIVESILSEELAADNCDAAKRLIDEYNSILMNGCNCQSELNCCDSTSCCSHGGNYKLQRSSGNCNECEIVLNSNSNDLIYECSKQCKCSKDSCLNRLVQYGPRKHLEIIETQFKAKGLKTLRNIPRGAFICEYAGELLTLALAEKRFHSNELHGKMNYILCLNELPNTSKECESHKLFVDPSKRGNIGRYLNHSCNPNCEILSVRSDCPVPKIGIFARRNIEAGEELCFHYGGGIHRKEYGDTTRTEKSCYCGSENCEKFMPNMLI